jgi:predicted SprT family Zn-dependent metalloprotease
MPKREESKVVKVEPYNGSAKCQVCQLRKAGHKVTMSGGGVMFVCTPCLQKLPRKES